MTANTVSQTSGLSTFEAPALERPSEDRVRSAMFDFKARIRHYQSADPAETVETGQFGKRFDQNPAVRLLPMDDYARGRLNGLYEGLYWALNLVVDSFSPVANTLRSDVDIQAKMALLRDQIWFSYLLRERERLLDEGAGPTDTIPEIMRYMTLAMWKKLGDEQVGEQNLFAEGCRDGMYTALAWVLGQYGKPDNAPR